MVQFGISFQRESDYNVLTDRNLIGHFGNFFSLPMFQAELIDPALKGTLNVLKSCTKAPSVNKVVLTSSMAAVIFNGKPLTPDVVVDETWFSDPEICEKSKVCICVKYL